MNANDKGRACVDALFPEAHVAWREPGDGAPADWHGFIINIPDVVGEMETARALAITRGADLDEANPDALALLLAIGVMRQGGRAAYFRAGQIEIVLPPFGTLKTVARTSTAHGPRLRPGRHEPPLGCTRSGGGRHADRRAPSQLQRGHFAVWRRDGTVLCGRDVGLLRISPGRRIRCRRSRPCWSRLGGGCHQAWHGLRRAAAAAGRHRHRIGHLRSSMRSACCSAFSAKAHFCPGERMRAALNVVSPTPGGRPAPSRAPPLPGGAPASTRAPPLRPGFPTIGLDLRRTTQERKAALLGDE
jgi:hypothetical protein